MIDQCARRWRREHLRRDLFEGLARLLTWPAAAAVGLAVIDTWVPLPRPARQALLACGVLAVAAAAFRWLLGPWLRFRWDSVLDAAEAEFPQLRSHFRAAWELGRGLPPNVSADLAREHITRTEGLLAGIPARPLFRWSPSPWSRRGALAACLAAVSLPVVGPGPSWRRVLAPWSEPALEDRLEISPGDAAVEAGSSVRIAARWKPAEVRRSPGELRLWLRSPGVSWRQGSWDELSGEAAYVAAGLTEPLAYRLSWRGDWTREYKIRTVVPPRWHALEAVVQGPQGAERAHDLVPGLELAVIVGSRIRLKARANQDLAAASLQLPFPPRDLKLEGRGQHFEGNFVLAADAALTFALTTPDGRADAQPPVYPLRALADQPPIVELLSPLAPLQASPRDAIPIAYAARDDLGLRELALRTRVDGGVERRIPLRRFAAGTAAVFGEHSWDLGGLRPGSRAEFRVEALDNAARPQAGFSAWGSVEIVDFEAVHGETQRLWLAAEKNLEALAAAQERAAKLAKDLGASPADPQALRRELEERLSGLPGAWRISVKSLESLAAAMSNDPLSNAGLAAQLSELSRDLAGMERDALKEASASARRGDWPAAEKQHGRLAKRLRSAHQTLRSGRGLQGLQDIYSQAGRMAQSGSDVEAALERLSDGAGGSEEARRDLAAAMARLEREMAELRRALEALPVPAADSPSAGETVTLPVHRAESRRRALEAAIAAGNFAEAARLARELAAELSSIQRALGAAAARSAPGRPSERLEKAKSMWSEVIAGQTEALGASRRIEAGRLEELLGSQRQLMKELAQRQEALVSSATAMGGEVPEPALAAMRKALEELQARRGAQAIPPLAAAAARLEAGAAGPPPGDPRLRELAAAEELIRRALEAAPTSPPKGPADSQCLSGADAQGAVRSKTGRLAAELEDLAAEGELPMEPFQSVGRAQAEQAAAERSLREGDASAAAESQERALRLLEQGLEQAGRSMEQRGGNQSTALSPFEEPAGPGTIRRRGGRSGADTGYVPLPAARDYRPPRELREELERSLRERRPQSMDGVIREYFRRIAE